MGDAVKRHGFSNRFYLTLLAIGAGFAISLWIYFSRFEVANVPSNRQVLNPERFPAPSYDLWGQSFTAEESARLLNSERRGELSSEKGAVQITEESLRLGRDSFYRETFNNEIFLTDVLGLLDGPLTRWEFVKAALKTFGRGTTDLKVALAKDIRIGDRVWRKGEKVSTGLDIPRGSLLPLGIQVSYNRGKLRAGITCAACHSTVDGKTKKVIEGGVNTDLNAGLLLAMAPNSAAYFPHADRKILEQYAGDISGDPSHLPPPETFERAVDIVLAAWAPGSFDSTIDLVSNPTQIPDSFTLGDSPYGWSGFAQVGPFKGLSALSNNVHAQNSDSTTQFAVSPALLGVSPESFLALIFRNASEKGYRFPVGNIPAAKDFVDSIKSERWSVGLNQALPSPNFPMLSAVAPDGVFATSPKHKFWEQMNAMSAWQNTLKAPPAPVSMTEDDLQRGRQVFENAKCNECHSGAFLSNNRVVEIAKIGTEATLARSFQKAETVFSWQPRIYPFSAQVPPDESKTLPVPVEDPEQVRMAWGFDGAGGIKVPALRGLYWSAPYLHDGGVAFEKSEGGRSPASAPPVLASSADPIESLRALIDRNAREQVISYNKSIPERQMTRMTGEGHSFWVDAEAGFSEHDQNALIKYLISIR